MTDIGARLKKIRTDKGLSLRELAKHAHISHSFIADIETGRSKPSIDTLEALATALDVSLSALIDHSAEKQTNSKKQSKKDSGDSENLREPSQKELEEIMKQEGIMFDGAPLDDEDKQDIMEVMKIVWKTIQKRKKN